jgi:alpha/beta superfamily hydrolase
VAVIESPNVVGPEGPLEALLRRPAAGPAAFAALVCHPHPLHGGTMHNKVVFSIARVLADLGAAVLRFNFRGVGRSAGAWSGGVAERGDVRAALDWLAARYPGAPLCAGGFSFGAWAAAPVACADPRVTQLVAVGTPTRLFEPAALEGCRIRKLFVQGGADEHGPPAELAAWTDALPGPKTVRVIRGADHVFTGRQGELRAVLAAYFEAEGPPPAASLTVRDRGPSNSQR